MSSNGQGADVVVVGAGHNGLTAACYLQKSGLSTLVLEASPTVGGMLSTNPVIAGAPDHQVNEGGIQASLFRATTIESDLQLGRYGLRQLIADPYHVHLDPDGPSLAIWRDPERTAAEIRQFSPQDADAWLDLARALDAAMDLVVPFMLGHPTRPSPAAVVKTLYGLRHRKELAPIARMFTTSHAEFIEENFVHPLTRGALAAMPPFSWMTQDGTGWALIYLAVCQRTNSARFEGGSGALTDSLHACLVDNGGRVRTSAAVTDLVMSGGRVSGVRLASGEEIPAGVVMASCSPVATLNELLPEGVLPEHLQRRAARIPKTTVEAASLKIDVALSGRLELPRHQAWRKDDLDLRKPIISWHTYEDHVNAWDETVGRRWPDPIPFIGIVPTAIDPTQAPQGQDTFWLWSGITPANPTERWEDVRDRIGDAVLAECAEYYAGLDKLEIGRRVFNAPDLEERFNVPGGNVYHVDPVAFRFGPMRPAPGFGSYETPVPGLWLTGAGTHPTGGISGIPGQVAAKALMKKVAKGDVPRWRPSPAASNSNGHTNGAAPQPVGAATTTES